MTWDCVFGLWLNVGRLRLTRAVAAAHGYAAATSAAPLGRDWFDAACLLESQVDELMFRSDAARAVARAKSKTSLFGV